jgi:hypothetical protein
LKWKYTTNGDVICSPAALGGVVYVGSDDGNVYALDALTGTLKWKSLLGGSVSDTGLAISGGVIYAGSWNDNIYALDASTGAVKWSYKTGDRITAAPAVSSGKVFVGSHDYYLYAFAPPNKPPDQPSAPAPADGSLDQPLSSMLGWTGGDPNGDKVTYIVYLDTAPSPATQRCQGASNSCSIPGLSYGTKYYWRVAASDGKAPAVNSPVWSFTTQGPGTGGMSITSTPPGAEVYIDGQLKGITPVNLSDLAPGSYRIGCWLSGYKGFEGSLAVNAGATTPLDCPMEAAGQPSVSVAAEPEKVDTGKPSRITVTAKEAAGSPLSEAEVDLTSSPAGLFTSSSGKTDPQGQFSTDFTSTSKGEFRVKASVKDKGREYPGETIVEVMGYGAAASMLLAMMVILAAAGCIRLRRRM